MGRLMLMLRRSAAGGAIAPESSPGEVISRGYPGAPDTETPGVAGPSSPAPIRAGRRLEGVTPLHDTDLRGFASDNYSGIHPEVLAAIAAANDGHQVAYGEDDYTARLQEVFAHHFGEGVEAFPVFNGTGANVVGLQSMLPRWGAVIAASTAHINVDEGGAPERVAGIKLLTVPTDDGKLTPELIDREAWGWGDEHRAQPLVVSITQSTELGTCTRSTSCARSPTTPTPRHAPAHGRRAHLERRGIPRPAAARIHARRRESTCSASAAPRTARCSARRSWCSTPRHPPVSCTSANSTCSCRRRCGSSQPS